MAIKNAGCIERITQRRILVAVYVKIRKVIAAPSFVDTILALGADEVIKLVACQCALVSVDVLMRNINHRSGPLPLTSFDEFTKFLVVVNHCRKNK